MLFQLAVYTKVATALCGRAAVAAQLHCNLGRVRHPDNHDTVAALPADTIDEVGGSSTVSVPAASTASGTELPRSIAG